MLDVDGTTVRYDYSALPTDNVAQAIQQAQKHVTVCLVTGRSFIFLEKVFEKLQMHSGFAVVNNGAQVVDIAQKKVIHEQLIAHEDAKKIVELFRQEDMEFFAKGDPFVHEYYTVPPEVPEDFSPPMFFTMEKYPTKKIDDFMKKLSIIPNIVYHKTQHSDPDKFGVLINHVDATKGVGIYHLEKHLGITRDEMIGVGDSYNDFALLMACGLKVAMGNAAPELKEIADYIAPSVDEDGLVDVIKKYILTA